MRLHHVPGSQGWELAESGTSQAGSSRIHTLSPCTQAHMGTAPAVTVLTGQSPAEEEDGLRDEGSDTQSQPHRRPQGP